MEESGVGGHVTAHLGEGTSPVVFRRPQLLAHPNIPKPLHGVAPRVVMGRKWWDEKRQAAYAANDFHCWACGVHKSVALVRNCLEAHESYDINYDRGLVRLQEIVALCHFCHNFIHSGRLWAILRKGEISGDRFVAVMAHGFRVLRESGVSPWWYTIQNWIRHEYALPEDEAFGLVAHLIPEEEYSAARWDLWRLEIDGQSFGPAHESHRHWKDHYDNPED